MLVKKYNFDVNVKDKIRATPLHFAILKKEFKNVELLIKFGADVNAQDFLGQAPIHIAVMRLSQDADSVPEYKRIIKELLFNGADKTLVTQSDDTAMDLLNQISQELTEEEYNSLKVILG